MIRNRTIALALVSSVYLSPAAFAGPMLPCLSSTLSANREVLVTSDRRFDDPEATHPRHVVSSIYEVHRRYTELNSRLRLNGPNAYWDDPFWKVDFGPESSVERIDCSYVLVPDDGEFLVFVGLNVGADGNALTIYHHRAHDPSLGPLVSQQGELVRKIRRGELWSSDLLGGFISDGTPQWFAGGRFSFSTDQKRLNYVDKNRRKLQVILRTGEVSRWK